MTRVTFYRTGARIFMASLALFMKCIRPGKQVLITRLIVALTAVVGVIIFNVVMAVQTVQTITVCMLEVGEQNLAGLILKHESHWIIRGRG